MDWNKGRRSSNVEDRRSGGGGGGGKLGIGAMLAVVVVSVLLGKNPIEMLGLIESSGVAEVLSGTSGEPAGTAPPVDDREAEFVARILGDTEDVWGAQFRQAGQQYAQPKLVLFGGRVQSACGGATSATGPFYCPADQQVYLDTSFFSQMRTQLGGGGDFAEAYVIAHEVGHHIQTLLGVSAEVNKARQRGENVMGDGGLLVRQELQADCLAGVWAHHSQRGKGWLDQAGNFVGDGATVTERFRLTASYQLDLGKAGRHSLSALASRENTGNPRHLIVTDWPSSMLDRSNSIEAMPSR